MSQTLRAAPPTLDAMDKVLAAHDPTIEADEITEED